VQLKGKWPGTYSGAKLACADHKLSKHRFIHRVTNV